MFTNRSLKQSRAAMSLVEVLVAAGVSSLMFLGIGSFIIYTGQNMAGIYNHVDLEQNSRHVEQLMTREIREAARLKEYSANKLVFVDFDGADLVYEYSPESKTLVRQKGENQEILLNNCDTLNFSLYKQTPVKGSYDLLPKTTSITSAKVIGATWSCSRTVVGKVNQELMREVLVVVRKS